MQAPRLPSIFKSPKVRRFSFPVRYYDERKERIENLKKGRRSKIKFKNNRYSGVNQDRYFQQMKRTRRLLLVIIALTLVAYSILKQENWI